MHDAMFYAFVAAFAGVAAILWLVYLYCYLQFSHADAYMPHTQLWLTILATLSLVAEPFIQHAKIGYLLILPNGNFLLTPTLITSWGLIITLGIMGCLVDDRIYKTLYPTLAKQGYRD